MARGNLPRLSKARRKKAFAAATSRIAQAAEAYIKSQAHEGWKLISDHHDDGGYSGGTMEHPALRRLLEVIGAGRIDIVVVYKVDRLTRSLADFAKLVELFDAHKVSFVSVIEIRRKNETADAESDIILVDWRKPSSTRRRDIILPETSDGPVRPIRVDEQARLLKGIALARRWLDELVAGKGLHMGGVTRPCTGGRKSDEGLAKISRARA